MAAAPSMELLSSCIPFQQTVSFIVAKPKTLWALLPSERYNKP